MDEFKKDTKEYNQNRRSRFNWSEDMPLEEAKPDDKIYFDNNMKNLDGIEIEIKKSLEQI